MFTSGPTSQETESGKIDRIVAYWEGVRGARRMPSRADIDPADLVGLLGNLMLLDVLRDPLDFRYRLIGTEIDYHSQGAYTGQRISEIPHRAPPSTIWDNCVAVVESREPSHRTIPYVGTHKDFLRTRQVMLPLSNDDIDVHALLVAIAYLRM